MSSVTSCHEHFGHEQLEECTICLKKKVRLLEAFFEHNASVLEDVYERFKNNDLVAANGHIKECECIGCRCASCPCTCFKDHLDFCKTLDYSDLEYEFGYKL